MYDYLVFAMVSFKGSGESPNDPILIEVDSLITLTTKAINDLSDNEVDEDIFVESPQIF